jgi:CheY-like chemotaxis protein
MLKKDDSILLIEDDRVDIMTVQRVLQKNQSSNPLYIARTGYDALNMLRGEAGQEKIKPALILLDLNLPMMSGIEFLHQLRSDAELKRPHPTSLKTGMRHLNTMSMTIS